MNEQIDQNGDWLVNCSAEQESPDRKGLALRPLLRSAPRSQFAQRYRIGTVTVNLAERANGWYQVRMKGKHRHFKHPSKPGLVTVPGNLGKELAVGTLDSVFDQAGLKQ